MSKRLSVPFDELHTVHHLADIHIRNLKRHKEYKQVFKKLYEKLSEDTENAIILVNGDIVHAKLEMSPELVDLTSDFFVNLTNIMPTIVVIGNHDCNLNNRTRLDALSPIIYNLNIPNLFYLKKSGIYRLADVSFAVMSVFDNPSNYLKADEVPGDTKIALYHGTVDRSVSENGYVLSNEKVSRKTFDGYDLSLLGDIHKRQYLNPEHTIAYPGSLIQQKHGEDLEHGYLKWDIKKRKARFIQIPNEYGYYTLYIENGKIPVVDDIPERARLRLRVKDTDMSEIQRVMVEIRKKYPKIEEIVVNRTDNLSNKSADMHAKIDIGNVTDANYQYELIGKYLRENYFVDKETLEKIRELNLELNNKLEIGEAIRNVVWKPEEFVFSNLFSYGEANSIDFSQMKGVVGLFAPNASGKSSLLDAVSYTLFDKSSRAFKAVHVMNNKKSRLKGRLKLDINGNTYFIERSAKKNKRGHAPVLVDFYQVDSSGDKLSLNADQRYSTNKMIRDYLGTYDDFALTALSSQKPSEKSSFIDMKQADRKTLLSQFLDLGVFDSLYEIANDEYKDIGSILKDMQKRNFPVELAETETDLKCREGEYEQKTQEKRDLEKHELKLSNKRLELTKQLINVVNLSADIETLETTRENIRGNILTLKENIRSTEKTLKELEDLVYDKKKYMLENFVGIDKKNKDYEELKSKVDECRKNVDDKKKDLKVKKEQLEKLKDLKYDPECEYCMTNPFTLDAIETRKLIKQDEDEERELADKLKKEEEKLEQLSEIPKSYEKYQNLMKEVRELDQGKSNMELTKSNLENQLDKAEHNLEKNEKEIDQYYKNQKAIEKNKRTQEQIDIVETDLEKTENLIEALEEEIRSVHGTVKVLENKINLIETEMKRFQELEEKHVALQYYLEAIKKDGIPYELIKKTLPVIETEINNILGQMVEFQILLEDDGRNISASIVYDEYNIWPIELVSGMERFISSIAIRVALLNISNLPRPNFLAIDEGFSSLDGDNVNNLHMLFDYLKQRFDFILVISHIDSMRDMVDTIMEIKKHGEYSYVKFP